MDGRIAINGLHHQQVVRDREDREAIAGKLVSERGMTLVPPFDDLAIIAGQGTVGLEIARQAEALAHEEGVPERKPQKARSGSAAKVDKDADTLALEKRVSDALGLAVTVSHRDPGGTVQINYRNLEQLGIHPGYVKDPPPT